MPGTNELCCEICGVLETLDGAYFDYEELHKCGDFKIVKQRRTSRKYNFIRYMEKHRKIITTNGHTLSFETINKTNEIFERINWGISTKTNLDAVCGLQDLERCCAVSRREVRSKLLLAASATKSCG